MGSRALLQGVDTVEVSAIRALATPRYRLGSSAFVADEHPQPRLACILSAVPKGPNSTLLPSIGMHAASINPAVPI
jgi:hypothetical protein